MLLRRMSLSRSRVFPGVCTKAHEGVFQGAPRGGAHTRPPGMQRPLHCSCAALSWFCGLVSSKSVDEVNVTVENAEAFGSVVVAAGGAVKMLPISLSSPLPLLRTHPPSLLVCCFCVFAEMGATSTASGRLEVNLLLSEKGGGKSHFGIILSENLKILHSQLFAAAYIHAD